MNVPINFALCNLANYVRCVGSCPCRCVFTVLIDYFLSQYFRVRKSIYSAIIFIPNAIKCMRRLASSLIVFFYEIFACSEKNHDPTKAIRMCRGDRLTRYRPIIRCNKQRGWTRCAALSNRPFRRAARRKVKLP